jgi:mannose/cellobiose epimerase-like protein (N-acyl-D-glucosamine 2-epimerase family)
MGGAVNDGFKDLPDAWAWSKAWLFDQALPLWSGKGADPAGGFHDRLDDEGRPVPGPKRLRVQARQTFAFVQAGKLGWTGPWRQTAAHGVAFLTGKARREDGLYASRFDATGAHGCELYDQAFVLLGLAHGYSVTGEAALAEAARDLFDTLTQRLARSGGGFLELPGSTAPFEANSQMHLLEALMAWRAVQPDGPWTAAAASQAKVGREVFIDPATGELGEFFEADGRPMGVPVVEPGHQIEWASLLLEENPEVNGPAAERLIREATRNIDRRRELALSHPRSAGNETLNAGETRLWPQTERLRAALAMRARNPGEADFWTDEALQSANAVRAAADAVGGGMYRDLIRADGTYVVEPSKASTLYHLMGGFIALRAAAEG